MKKRPIVSLEVRKAIIRVLAGGTTFQSTADLFSVGVATVYRIWRRFRTKGKSNLGRRGGGRRPSITLQEESLFLQMLQDHSDATYDELTCLWQKKSGKKIARSAVVRMVKKLGYTRKKKTVSAEEKDSPTNVAKRDIFLGAISNAEHEKLVFLDESGFHGKLDRTHARAPRGDRAVVVRPARTGKNVTICGAIRSSGPIVMQGKPAPMTRRWFLAFLAFFLFPRLSPGDILVMDNLSAHKGEAITQLAERWSIQLLYLPPYSPELNPIEMVWSVMKSRLRGRRNRSLENFRYAIAGAWRRIQRIHIPSLLKSCIPSLSCQTA